MTQVAKRDAGTNAPLLLRRGRLWWMLIFVSVITVLLALVLDAYFSVPPVKLSKVIIAVPTQINSAPMIVAFEQGLFKNQGLEVVNQPFLLGKDALKSVLDDKADLAVVADTPFMLSVLGGSDIGVLAGISEARRALAIVVRSDRQINQVKDLKGKTIGLTLGTNFPYFLDMVLRANALKSDDLTLRDLKVDPMIAAFKSGEIDAAVVFQPYLAQLEAEMGGMMTVFYGEDVYAFRFLLVGKPAYIDAHPQEIQRILKALSVADRAISSQPLQARRQVGTAVKVDDAIMERFFDPEDYVVSLNQAMLAALDEQTRWAMARGLVKPGPVPNYLKYIKYQNLEAINPTAVKLVH
jgi:ABC-type nitrate/sulfonate/bicarbonate transport system substrate-binding protein